MYLTTRPSSLCIGTGPRDYCTTARVRGGDYCRKITSAGITACILYTAGLTMDSPGTAHLSHELIQEEHSVLSKNTHYYHCTSLSEEYRQSARSVLWPSVSALCTVAVSQRALYCGRQSACSVLWPSVSALCTVAVSQRALYCGRQSARSVLWPSVSTLCTVAMYTVQYLVNVESDGQH